MHPSSVRLRHLTAFVEVARQRSVVRAARSLSVTQPAVSKSLRELETILGVSLLDRTRGDRFLSPQGEVFLPHAEASLAALRRGVEEVDAAITPGSPVRIGALPTVSARLLPDAVSRLGLSLPGAIPKIVTGPTDMLAAQLRQGVLDVMIGRMRTPDEMTGLAFEHLYSEPIVFAVRAGHPLAGGSWRPQDMNALECLLPPPGSTIRATVDAFFVSANLPRPARVIETVSLAFSRRYVRATDAVWVISEGVVLDDLDDGHLVRLPLDTRDTMGPVGITTLADKEVSTPLRLLLDELRAVAAIIRREAAAGPDGRRDRIVPSC